jgi:hypothetical protein
MDLECKKTAVIPLEGKAAATGLEDSVEGGFL